MDVSRGDEGGDLGMNFDLLYVRNKCYYPFLGKHASGNVFLADYGGTGSNANGMSV